MSEPEQIQPSEMNHIKLTAEQAAALAAQEAINLCKAQFHAELMTIMQKVHVRDDLSCCSCNCVFIIGYSIEQLSEKYAPAEPEEG